jgi:hypothetical protein
MRRDRLLILSHVRGPTPSKARRVTEAFVTRRRRARRLRQMNSPRSFRPRVSIRAFSRSSIPSWQVRPSPGATPGCKQDRRTIARRSDRRRREPRCGISEQEGPLPRTRGREPAPCSCARRSARRSDKGAMRILIAAEGGRSNGTATWATCLETQLPPGRTSVASVSGRPPGFAGVAVAV